MNRLRSMIQITLIGRRTIRRLADARLLDRMCVDEHDEKRKLRGMVSELRRLSAKRFFDLGSWRIVRR